MCCPFLQAMAASLERKGSLLWGGARVVQNSLFKKFNPTRSITTGASLLDRPQFTTLRKRWSGSCGQATSQGA